MKDKQVILKESFEYDKNFFLDKLKRGCISGSESNIIGFENGEGAKFEIKSKKGKTIHFYTDYYYSFTDGETPSGKWRCNTSKSNNNTKKEKRLVDPADVNTVDY
jgi:hypothetical protein